MLPLLYIEFLPSIGIYFWGFCSALISGLSLETQFLICTLGSSFSPFLCFIAPILCYASTFSLLSAKRISSSFMALSMSHALDGIWHYFSGPDLPELQAHVASCPLSLPWRINLHFKFNISESELLIFPRTWFSHEASVKKQQPHCFCNSSQKSSSISENICLSDCARS